VLKERTPNDQKTKYKYIGGPILGVPVHKLGNWLMDGCISAATPLALADQLPLPIIVKRGRSGFLVRRAI